MAWPWMQEMKKEVAQVKELTNAQFEELQERLQAGVREREPAAPETKEHAEPSPTGTDEGGTGKEGGR